MSDVDSKLKSRSQRVTLTNNEQSGANSMDKEKIETEKKSDHNRVVISTAANASLEKVRLNILNGTDDVDMSKSDLANYIFENIDRLMTEQDMRTLRSTFFNESKFLDSLRKKSAEGEELPAHIRKAIREHLNERDLTKKRVASAERSDT